MIARPAPPTQRRPGWLPLLAAAVAIAVVAGVRYRLADVPLERDEGEYAYAAQLILDGMPPYAAAYNMKFPGVYYAYAAIFAVFGETTRAIHLGLILVTSASALLLLDVTRRAAGETAGAVSAAVFAILSLDRGTLGLFAHATHFVVFFVLLATALLLRGFDHRRVAWFVAAGLALGCAVLMKQHAVMFVLAAAAAPVAAARGALAGGRREYVARSAALLGGAFVPLGVLAALLAYGGLFDRFWFWTVQYAAEYASTIPLAAAPMRLREGLTEVTRATLPFWILAALGCAALWWTSWPAATRLLCTGLLVAGAAATIPGYYFRPHYFLVLVPGLALACGIAVESLRRTVVPTWAPRSLAVAVLALGPVATWGWSEREYLFAMDPVTVSRDIYGANPFVESPVIARYLREHTTDGDTVAVLGSEPQIYFYAGRRSATGYLYMYPLMEDQPFALSMRSDLVRELERGCPSYVVFVNVYSSWSAGASATPFFQWVNGYLAASFERVGVADIRSSTETSYAWGSAAGGAYGPTSVLTFRRRTRSRCEAAAHP